MQWANNKKDGGGSKVIRKLVREMLAGGLGIIPSWISISTTPTRTASAVERMLPAITPLSHAVRLSIWNSTMPFSTRLIPFPIWSVRLSGRISVSRQITPHKVRKPQADLLWDCHAEPLAAQRDVLIQPPRAFTVSGLWRKTQRIFENLIGFSQLGILFYQLAFVLRKRRVAANAAADEGVVSEGTFAFASTPPVSSTECPAVPPLFPRRFHRTAWPLLLLNSLSYLRIQTPPYSFFDFITFLGCLPSALLWYPSKSRNAVMKLLILWKRYGGARINTYYHSFPSRHYLAVVYFMPSAHNFYFRYFILNYFNAS